MAVSFGDTLSLAPERPCVGADTDLRAWRGRPAQGWLRGSHLRARCRELDTGAARCNRPAGAHPPANSPADRRHAGGAGRAIARTWPVHLDGAAVRRSARHARRTSGSRRAAIRVIANRAGRATPPDRRAAAIRASARAGRLQARAPKASLAVPSGTARAAMPIAFIKAAATFGFRLLFFLGFFGVRAFLLVGVRAFLLRLGLVLLGFGCRLLGAPLGLDRLNQTR